MTGSTAGEEAEGQARVEPQGQAEGPQHVDHVVEVVLGQRRGHPVGHHDDGGHGEAPPPAARAWAARAQRRDRPPLLHATQSRA